MSLSTEVHCVSEMDATYFVVLFPLSSNLSLLNVKDVFHRGSLTRPRRPRKKADSFGMVSVGFGPLKVLLVEGKGLYALFIHWNALYWLLGCSDRVNSKEMERTKSVFFFYNYTEFSSCSCHTCCKKVRCLIRRVLFAGLSHGYFWGQELSRVWMYRCWVIRL